MTIDHTAEIEAAEARLREAQADVDRLRARLAGELAAAKGDPSIVAGVRLDSPTAGRWSGEDKPKPQTREDALAEVRRRHGRTRSEIKATSQDTGTGTGGAEGDALPLSGAALGRAEAQRRYGRRS
jgi:hypothetical protein